MQRISCWASFVPKESLSIFITDRIHHFLSFVVVFFLSCTHIVLSDQSRGFRGEGESEKSNWERREKERERERERERKGGLCQTGTGFKAQLWVTWDGTSRIIFLSFDEHVLRRGATTLAPTKSFQVAKPARQRVRNKNIFPRLGWLDQTNSVKPIVLNNKSNTILMYTLLPILWG